MHRNIIACIEQCYKLPIDAPIALLRLATIESAANPYLHIRLGRWQAVRRSVERIVSTHSKVLVVAPDPTDFFVRWAPFRVA